MSITVSDYLPGTDFGLPASTLVHRWANIAGTLTCGEHCRIDAFVTITGTVGLGDRVHIGAGAALFGTAGIKIGSGTSISPGAKVFSASEDVHSVRVSNPQALDRATVSGAVRVGKCSVIGANAVVLPGVIVGHGSVVAALTVVPSGRVVEDHTVVLGPGARIIMPRELVNVKRALGER